MTIKLKNKRISNDYENKCMDDIRVGFGACLL
jgi:hypothetical protein